MNLFSPPPELAKHPLFTNHFQRAGLLGSDNETTYDVPEIERRLNLSLSALTQDNNMDNRRPAEVPSGLSGGAVLCAALPDELQCTNKGVSFCSGCRLVKYCGKDHQVLHWSKHKAICKNPYIRPNWEPAWKAQRRTPAFLSDENDAAHSDQVAFGRRDFQYVWGNTIAVDCFRTAHLEGVDEGSTKNFNIAFVASGDIRNMVHSVNNLPRDYTGTCNILLNDINPLQAARNAIVALTLMDDRLTVDEASVAAIHLMYSVALPKSISAHFLELVRTLYISDQNQVELPSRGQGKLHISQGALGRNKALSSFLSTYKLSTALKSRKEIMLGDSRVDYRDRHILSLLPAHRVSYTQYRSSGILSPLFLNLVGFTEPNRLLFSPIGEWLLMDSADPLQGWDVEKVIESGARHGLGEEDIYGCLYYHAMDEFQEFAKRVRDMKINVQISSLNALDLPKGLSSLKLFDGNSRFDRIETSNVADYVGTSSLLDATAPLLNKKNKCSTILVSYMNWHRDLPQDLMSRAMKQNPKARQLLQDMLGKAVFDFQENMTTIMTAISVIHDTSKEFQAFLKKQDVTAVARRHGLKQRKRNRVHTKRYGIPMDKQGMETPELNQTEFYRIFCIGGCDSPPRWIEFEPA